MRILTQGQRIRIKVLETIMVEFKPNLLLLTMDAWRADFVDSFSGIPLTPALSSVAHCTLRFEQAYSTGPWTSPGIVSLFTGQDALSHGVWYPWSRPQSGCVSLTTFLLEAGYNVINSCYKTAADNYQNLGYDPALAPGYPDGPNDDSFPCALGRLAGDRHMPWFAWYHYKYVHLPYWPAADYRKMFGILDNKLPRHLVDSVCSKSIVPRGESSLNAEDFDILRCLYAANVRQMDEFLARVLTSLKKSGQLSNTTILITADHGDELLDHEHVGHASTARRATLFDEVLRIPLLIVDSRIKGPRFSRERVQLQDLMPTLLSLAGISPPPLSDAINLIELVDGAMRGSSCEPVAFSMATQKHRALRFHSSRMGYQTPRTCAGQAVIGFLENSTKYILERFDAEHRQLFNHANDPAERYPIVSGPLVDAAHQRLLELYPDLDLCIAPTHRKHRLHCYLEMIRATAKRLILPR